MTRKRAKKLLMRYTLSRNSAERVLKFKPDGISNEYVVNCYRMNYIFIERVINGVKTWQEV